jgi:hypothetical protein
VSLISSITNSIVRRAAGIIMPVSSLSDAPDLAQPSAVNPVSIVYGRPGWIECAPIAARYVHDHSLLDLHLYCIVGEGTMRMPDALRINSYLDMWSVKYDSDDLPTLESNLAALSSSVTGTASDGYGQRIINQARHFFGWPAGARYSVFDNDGVRFQGLSSLWIKCRLSSAAGDYVSDGELPTVEVLPNGRFLHDPRIVYDYGQSATWNPVSADNSAGAWSDYSEIIDFGRSVQEPGYLIGGTNPGWFAANIDYSDSISASRDYATIESGNNDLGDSPDNNPALVILDYLTAPVFGAGVPLADIDLISIAAYADYCDAQAPTYSGGPTQAQMACDISLDPTDKIRSNLEKLLGTCRGQLGWIDGQYRLTIRNAGLPTAFVITTDHIIKRASVSYGTRADRFNRAIGTYVEPSVGYEERQVVYTHDDYVTTDGETVDKEFDLQGCANVYRAADLLQTYVMENRASITAEYRCTLDLLVVQAGDLVTVTDDLFEAQLFWVEKTTISWSSRSITLSLRQHNDAAYDNLVQPADITPPGGSAVDATVVQAVSGLTYTPQASWITTIGGVLSWTAPVGARVDGYLVEVLADGASQPTWSTTLGHESSQITLPYLPRGDYLARVYVLYGSLRSSASLLAFTHDVPGANVLPLAFQLVPGINRASILLQVPDGYWGLTVWFGDAAGPVGSPVHQGQSLTIELTGLTSGTTYQLWYAATASDLSTGTPVGPIALTTSNLQAADLSWISDWALQTDPVDEAFLMANLAGGSISEALLAAGSVTTAKLADLAVTAAQLADGAVGTVKIAADAITTEKLADLAVTAAQLAESSVTATKIANLAVGTAAIQTGAVGSLQVDDAAITSAKIANLAVGTAAIADLAVTDAKIQQLTASKITAGIITATVGIQSSGSIETVNSGYKTGIGVYDDGSTIWTLISADDTGTIKSGITADGVLYAQDAEIVGTVMVGKSGYADAAPGVWMGLDGGVPKLSVGGVGGALSFDGADIVFTGEMQAAAGEFVVTSAVDIASGSYGSLCRIGDLNLSLNDTGIIMSLQSKDSHVLRCMSQSATAGSFYSAGGADVLTVTNGASGGTALYATSIGSSVAVHAQTESGASSSTPTLKIESRHNGPHALLVDRYDPTFPPVQLGAMSVINGQFYVCVDVSGTPRWRQIALTGSWAAGDVVPGA